MFVDRVPYSRPNTPEEPVEMVDSHQPPVMSTTDDVPLRANHQHHHLEQRQVSGPPLMSGDNSYYHVYHGATGRQAYTAEEIKHILLTHGQVVGTTSHQPPVQIYDQHHHGHPRHAIPSALYPTPPLPAASPSMVRIPMVKAEPNQDQHQTLTGIQPAPNFQPLTVFTERQACTELSPPTDMAKYKGKDYKGLLVTMDGTIGGRSSPAPGTVASPEGHVGQYYGTPVPARRKRSFDGEHGSSCKKGRFSFTTDMLEILETRFAQGRYIAADERKALANTLGIADVQVKNWFQNRRMKWKRQATSHTVTSSESKPATLPQVQMSVPSSVVENMEKLAQHGNTKSGPAPIYPMKFPCTASSSVVSQLQPVHLTSNGGAIHPFMAGMASYPHGFAFPYAATMMQNVQNHTAQNAVVHTSHAVQNSMVQIPDIEGESVPTSVAAEVKVETEENVKEEKENGETS